MAEVVEKQTAVQHDDSSDVVRRIIAAVVGVIIIIVLILLARWLGDRIRERFFTKQTPTTTVQVIPPEENNSSPTLGQEPGQTNRTATFSAIPATGPSEMGYFLLVVLAFGGTTSLLLARRFS